MTELMIKAEQHHLKASMKYFGWVPWRKLIEKKRKQETSAQDFYKKILLRCVIFVIKLYHCLQTTLQGAL